MDKDLDEAIMNVSIMQTEEMFNARVRHVVESLIIGDENIRRELRSLATGRVDAFKNNLVANLQTSGVEKSLAHIIRDTYY